MRRGHGSFQAGQPVLVGWLIDLFLRPVPLWQRILMALGGVLVATIVRIPLEPMLHDVPYILFCPVILIVGLLGGPAAGFFAVLFASLIDQLASVQGLAMLATFWVICGLIITSASLVRALAASEERLNILAHEMTHRVRNMIGLVQAISRQTLRLRLLKTAFPPGHGAASILFNPDGVLCAVRFPGSGFSAAGQTGRL